MSVSWEDAKNYCSNTYRDGFLTFFLNQAELDFYDKHYRERKEDEWIGYQRKSDQSCKIC